MSEYIITLEQMHDLVESAAVEAMDGYKCGVVKQIWSFPKLPKIVRCRDCRYYDERDAGCSYFVLAKNKLLHIGNPNGFCAWGERLEK